MVPSITPLNVWDLPAWAWLGYADMVDQRRAAVARERARGGSGGRI